MKRTYFIKHDQRIRRIIGCDRATLIFDRLEFYSSRQPGGFYKFIEPNSHKLYKKDESWTELLNCHRTSFWRAFKLIGKKHTSRWKFEESEDKFEGKQYASYYDRNTNRMFFVRNHDAVKELFAKTQLSSELVDKEKNHKVNNHSCSVFDQTNNSLRTEQNAQSYKEPKNTSSNLSKDKYHAEDIVKKMIEIWTALVEEGRGQIHITAKRIAFLRQAFVDKFDSCLEKWKKYCQDIASSRFLMGEIKSSFRATLDWALKFDSIQKVFDGNYGVGDRNQSLKPSAAESFLKNSKMELDSEEEEIRKLNNESEPVRAFRVKWLKKFGASNYQEILKDCVIKVTNDFALTLSPSSRYNAKSIVSYWTPTLLEGSPFRQVHIFQQEGDLVFDKWFGTERVRAGGNDIVESSPELTEAQIVQSLLSRTDVVEADGVIENPPEEAGSVEDEIPAGELIVTQETQMLREKLRKHLPRSQFPSWLETIEVVDIGGDGVIVVTLEDSLAVGWCQSRFSGEILQACTSLWKEATKVVIQEKNTDRSSSSGGKYHKISEHVREKRTLEQAIQSLLSACTTKMSETFVMQGAYQAFC